MHGDYFCCFLLYYQASIRLIYIIVTFRGVDEATSLVFQQVVYTLLIF